MVEAGRLRAGRALMPNKWILIRAAVWLVVLGWVIKVMQTPSVHNELAAPAERKPPVGTDPGQVIAALGAIDAAHCGSGTLHLQVDGTGLKKAWIVPGMADTRCLEQVVYAQDWPALATPMEMEWPLSPATPAQ